MNKVLSSLGISKSSLQEYKQHPKFTGAVLRYNKEIFIEHVPDVINAMKDQAIGGNVHAGKIFLDWVQDIRDENPGAIQNPDVSEEEVLTVVAQLRKKKFNN